MHKRIVAMLLILMGACQSWPIVGRSAEQAADDNSAPRGFQRLWPIGTLDPARHQRWPAIEPGQCKLASIRVEPRFVQFIARGDAANPSNIDCYEVPELLAGKPFSPRFGGGERTRLTLFVDLGRTMPGTVEFEADVPAGTTMMVETGEAMLPTRAYSVTSEADDGRQVFRPVIAHGGWTSLRFAWIHFDKPSGPIVVHSVRGMYQVLPCNYVGDFVCSDDELTRIWEMCAYSAHAVMAQPVGDNTQPSRRLQTLCLDRVDRFPWAGDSRLVQTAVLDVFGEYDLIRSNLDGFLPKGTRPIPDLTGIAPYTLDWALAVIDFYQCSGDASYLAEHLDDLAAVIDKYDAMPPRWQDIQQPVGCDIWMFFDWDKRIARTIDVQTAAAFAGKYVQTCRALAEAATQIHRPEVAGHAAELSQKHVAQWRALYIQDWRTVYDIHAVTNLLLGDVLFTPEERTQAFDKVFADRHTRWTETPYFGSHVLTALAKLGRRAEAIEMLHDYWGTMIDAGATSVWEEWNPSRPLPVNGQPSQMGPPCTWGTASLIQPAGVGPARWLGREVLGIWPASPGFRQVRIEPHTLGLAWARGSVATPQGPVSVSWNDGPNRFEATIKTPAACETVTVALPPGTSYELDGQPVEPTRMEDGLAMFGVTAGPHTLTVLR